MSYSVIDGLVINYHNPLLPQLAPTAIHLEGVLKTSLAMALDFPDEISGSFKNQAPVPQTLFITDLCYMKFGTLDQ